MRSKVNEERQPDLEDDKYLLEQEEEKAPGKEGNESIQCDRVLEKKKKTMIEIYIWWNSRKKIKDWVRENNANEKNGQQVYEKETIIMNYLASYL